MCAIRTAVATRYISINQSIAEDRQKLPDTLLISLFRLVLGWVAPQALQLVARQLATYQKDIIVAECTHYHRRALGLPCIHKILVAVEGDQPLGRAQFHRQWWLLTSIKDDYQPLHLEDMLLVNDPKQAIAAGRPRGGANHARKDPNVVAAKDATDTTARQAIQSIITRRSTRLSRSTKRDPSGFEIARKRTDRIGRGGIAKDAAKKDAAKKDTAKKGAAKKGAGRWRKG
jgi:hypothetical protein